jgi:hypothetical protein
LSHRLQPFEIIGKAVSFTVSKPVYGEGWYGALMQIKPDDRPDFWSLKTVLPLVDRPAIPQYFNTLSMW